MSGVIGIGANYVGDDYRCATCGPDEKSFGPSVDSHQLGARAWGPAYQPYDKSYRGQHRDAAASRAGCWAGSSWVTRKAPAPAPRGHYRGPHTVCDTYTFDWDRRAVSRGAKAPSDAPPATPSAASERASEKALSEAEPSRQSATRELPLEYYNRANIKEFNRYASDRMESPPRAINRIRREGPKMHTVTAPWDKGLPEAAADPVQYPLDHKFANPARRPQSASNPDCMGTL